MYPRSYGSGPILKHLLKPILYPRLDGYGRREGIMFGLVSLTGAAPGSAQCGLPIPAPLMPYCLHAVNASSAMSMNCATCFFTPGFDSGGFVLGVRPPPFVVFEDRRLTPEPPSTQRSTHNDGKRKKHINMQGKHANIAHGHTTLCNTPAGVL